MCTFCAVPGSVVDPDPAALKSVLRIRIRKDKKLLPSRIQIQNKLISRIRIRNYHLGSGLLKDKCSDKNTMFNIKSLIPAPKWPLNVHSDLKWKNFMKISKTRIRIRKDPVAGSGSGTTLQVGSGSETNSFWSSTLLKITRKWTNIKYLFYDLLNLFGRSLTSLNFV